MACSNCACGKGAGGCGTSQGASSSSSASGPSVALPKNRPGATSESTPLWSTKSAADASKTNGYGSTLNGDSSAAAAAASPDDVPEGCDVSKGIRRQCCKDLKEEERHLIDPDIVRDCIIGLSDGLTVPFALTAGLSGVGSSRLVVIAGFAELVSGAISMGVGGLLSAQAEVQHFRFQSRALSERVRRSCAGEMEREVCEVLEPFGVDHELACKIADRLQQVENDECGTPYGELPSPAALAAVAASRRSDGLKGPSRGLTPFLLKLEGLEAIADSRMWISAGTIGMSYFLGGLIPLLPYIFIAKVQDALLYSIAITAIILLAFGAIKQRVTGGASDVKGLIYGAVSTLFIGAAAAACSWGIVYALEGEGAGI